MANHITVFGSPASGKSVFSAALAKKFSTNGKIILISGDNTVPMLPFFCGNITAIGLGALLSGEINLQKTAQAVKVLSKYPQIGVIGFQINDAKTVLTDKNNLLSLWEYLDNLVDFVVWDCTSDMETIFSSVAISKAKLCICILTADIKGCLFYENYRKRIQKLNEVLIYEGMGKPYSLQEEFQSKYGNFNGILPFSREIERICMEGKIFDTNKVCHNKYLEAIELAEKKLLLLNTEGLDA